jgi:hypothetical protein
MSNYYKNICTLLAGVTLITAIDYFLPTETIETSIDSITPITPFSQLVYGIPLGGGKQDSCWVKNDALQALQPKTEIIIETTAIFNRCVSIKPIPAKELECRKDFMATQYRQAIALERQLKMRDAYSTYSKLCNSYAPSNQEENPCTASLRLQNGILKAYEHVMLALSKHQLQTGEYPASLSEVLPELPQTSREFAKDFLYCKKEHPSDRTGICSNGSTSYGGSEVSIGTGLSGGDYFDFEKRPCLSFHQTRAKSHEDR